MDWYSNNETSVLYLYQFLLLSASRSSRARLYLASECAILASRDVARYGIFSYASISQSCRYHTNNLEDIFWYAARYINRHAKRPDEDDQSCKKHLHANPLCNHVDETQHSSVADYVLVFNIKVIWISRSIVGLMRCEIMTRWTIFVQQ
jgi:hypothetical protein